MTKHFVADLHLQHDNILAMMNRPFNNIDDHDEYMLNSINETVLENDTLYILGDVSWRNLDNFFNKIVCKNVHLIIGNHDKASYSKRFKVAEEVGIVTIPHQGGALKVFMSHYPHIYWPSSHHDCLHLYGHVHSEREEFLDVLFTGRRSMDAGIDNAKRLLGEYRPFSEHEIIKFIAGKPGCDNLGYYESRQLYRSQGLSTREIVENELRIVRNNINKYLGE